MNYCPNCGYHLANNIPINPIYPNYPTYPTFPTFTCENTNADGCSLKGTHSHLVAGKTFPCEIPMRERQ